MNNKKKYINWKCAKYRPFLKIFPPESPFGKYFEKICNLSMTCLVEPIKKDPCYHPDKGWNSFCLSLNPRKRIKYICENHNLWDWNFSVSQISAITVNDVLKYPKKPWNWFYISKNPNITFKDILEHPELPWNWHGVLCNPSITPIDFLKHSKLPKGMFMFNGYLSDKVVYKNNLKTDVKKRREKIINLNLFGSLNTLVVKYIGYV